MNGNWQLVVLELMFSGFFAVACIRAGAFNFSEQRSIAAPHWTDLLRLPGRIERLRRSRWQWFALVALMMVLRLQGKLPWVLEGMVTVEFLLFMAAPSRAAHPRKSPGRQHAAPVGSR